MMPAEEMTALNELGLENPGKIPFLGLQEVPFIINQKSWETAWLVQQMRWEG